MSERPGFLQAAALALASRYAARAHSAPVRNERAVRPRAAPQRGQPIPRRSLAPPQAAAQEHGRGREAETPAHIPAKGWKDIFWRVYQQIGKDRVLAVAAGVTFYGLLALFPLLAALVSIYGFFADPGAINQHLKTMSTVLPGGAIDVIGEQVSRIASQPRGQLGFGFIAGLAVTLWSANAGMKAVFDALNVAYNEDEKRSFLRLNLLSMTFTLAAIAFLIVAMLAVVILPAALEFLGFGPEVRALLNLARWPALLVVLVAALAVLYRYGPSRDEPRWSWLSPGAVVAAVVWLLASLAFSFYAANFGSYNETYGSLGAVIGFMTWMWISVTIILVGAEINAEAEHQTAQDTTEGPRQLMGERGAYMADNVAPSS